jgi:hypothetical protein
MCNHADIIEVSEQSSTTRGLIEGVALGALESRCRYDAQVRVIDC